MSVVRLIPIASVCRRAVDRLATGMGYVAGWGFVFCAFFITAEVLARNFLGLSSQATTELTGYILAFGMSWGLAHALAQRAHVRIDVVINRLPAAWRHWLHLMSLALLAAFVAFLAKGAVELVQESLLFGATDISLLRTPLAIPQSLWALGLLVFLTQIALMLVENLALIVSGRGPDAEANLQSRTQSEEAQEALAILDETRASTAGAPR